jgi:hypothetical protein
MVIQKKFNGKSVSLAIFVAIEARLFVVSHGEETVLMKMGVPIELTPRAL